MNRLWAAAGLLAVLITICTLAVISTQSITTSITQDIIQIADTSLQDDKDTALTLSRQAGEKWQNHHAVLCTFMSHMQLEEIDRSLNEGDSLSEEQECATEKLALSIFEYSSKPIKNIGIIISAF